MKYPPTMKLTMSQVRVSPTAAMVCGGGNLGIEVCKEPSMFWWHSGSFATIMSKKAQRSGCNQRPTCNFPVKKGRPLEMFSEVLNASPSPFKQSVMFLMTRQFFYWSSLHSMRKYIPCRCIESCNLRLKSSYLPAFGNTITYDQAQNELIIVNDHAPASTGVNLGEFYVLNLSISPMTRVNGSWLPGSCYGEEGVGEHDPVGWHSRLWPVTQERSVIPGSRRPASNMKL